MPVISVIMKFCEFLGLREKLKLREYGRSYRLRKRSVRELRRCYVSVSYFRDLLMSNLTDSSIHTICLELLSSHTMSFSSGSGMRSRSGLSLVWLLVTLIMPLMIPSITINTVSRVSVYNMNIVIDNLQVIYLSSVFVICNVDKIW